MFSPSRFERVTSLAIILLVTGSVHADCDRPRAVIALPGVPACTGLQTCIPRDRIELLKSTSQFPRYGDSMEVFRRRCEQSLVQTNVLELAPFLQRAAVPEETRLAVDVVTRTRERVQGTLLSSQARIQWTNRCVQALLENQVLDPESGGLNPAETTRKFHASGAESHRGCAALWDPQVARTPILQTAARELVKARQYLALSQNWQNPQTQSPLRVPDLNLRGRFFEGAPTELARLSPFELANMDQIKQTLIVECQNSGARDCSTSSGLQTYTRQRYWNQVSESPIVARFGSPVNADGALQPSELARAYREQSERMTALASVQLRDQDYLTFSAHLNQVLQDTDATQRGDACAVAGALIENQQSRERLTNMLTYGSYAIGGAHALVARGAIRRTLAFFIGAAPLQNLALMQETVSHYQTLQQIEAVCSQSHLRTNVCNTEAIFGNSDMILQNATGIGVATVMTAFGLYAPARRLIMGLNR